MRRGSVCACDEGRTRYPTGNIVRPSPTSRTSAAGLRRRPGRQRLALPLDFSGGNSGGFSKVTNGAISFSNLGPGSYTITGDKDGTVKCGRTPGAKTGTGEKKDAKKQYKKGFSDEFATIRKNCAGKLPQGLTAVDPNYEKGFNDGAALAAKTFCGKTD
ncbi:hypothetical protein ABZ845_03605 [Streptomyces sp. NPDC047022]|uniref:hypothetical protein n=1 Tax=Streptomyces sp. NPDC047022 TaxID=3155737 RepID=UPI0033F261AF